MLNKLFEVFQNNQDSEAIVWKGKSFSYGVLYKLVKYWTNEITSNNIKSGDIVVLKGDFSPNAIALFIALVYKNCIVVPIASKSQVKVKEYSTIAQAGHIIDVNLLDEVDIKCSSVASNNQLLKSLQASKSPGLVIFSSGSTGSSKGVVHDFSKLLKKFQKTGKKARVIGFLLFDHIGGINTLFYTLFNAGCLIITNDRTPQAVCELIESAKADALTTTPTFLNLLLLSGLMSKYDLSSLRIINYGTEIMPESTLQKLTRQLPNVRFSQAYGLSEVGVLPVRSKSSSSLYIKIGSEGFQTRIVDGLLEVKAESSMLGYLNAPQPIGADGWFKTGDAVEVDGDYLRILGRKSELINVGGEKVYPAEIENVLEDMSGVEQATVYAEPHAIIGQIVVAKIKLSTSESLGQFRKRVYKFCEPLLPKYQIPQKVILSNETLHNERFKKVRQTKELKNAI